MRDRKRSVVIRGAGVAAGIGMVVAAIVTGVRFAHTPALVLEHPAPPHRNASPYELAHTVSAPCPAAARTGLWIELPDLGVALPIIDGDGSNNNIPRCKAVHYMGTATPGQPGNSYLYAHGLWGMFGELLYARVGESVIVHDYSTGAVYTLHISRVVGAVRWNDTSWIHLRSAVPLLTLQTCVGADVHSDRWIVQAT